MLKSRNVYLPVSGISNIEQKMNSPAQEEAIECTKNESETSRNDCGEKMFPSEMCSSLSSSTIMLLKRFPYEEINVCNREKLHTCVS